MAQARRIYTVPPGRPFLTALAEALLTGDLPVPGGARPGPLLLADTTLLLPTRRATRALQKAFLEANLPTAQNSEDGYVPVTFHSKITELGVFELWCVSKIAEHGAKADLVGRVVGFVKPLVEAIKAP